MYIPRKAEGQVIDFLNSTQENKEVLVVGGARQVGKTTIIDRALESVSQKVTINFAEQRSVVDAIDTFKDFDEFNLYLKDKFGFDGNSGKTLYIDEAQESENLGNFVRFMKEKWRQSSVILSGSMIQDLFKERVPVGRIRPLTVRPLTFEEYLRAHDKTSLLELIESYELGQEIPPMRHKLLIEQLNEFLVVGGLPAVVRAKLEGLDWRAVRESILSNYFDDFKAYFGVEFAALAWKAFKSVCLNVGSPSKYTQVIPQQEKGYLELFKIFSKLEAWNLILFAEQRGDQPETELHPKRFFFDNGLLQQIRYTSRPVSLLQTVVSDEERRALGGVIENFVASELAFARPKLSGYKAPNYEIDFLVELKDSVLPVEIKASLRNKKQFMSALRLYLERYALTDGVCLTLDTPSSAPTTPPDTTRRLYFLPVYLIGQLGRLF